MGSISMKGLALLFLCLDEMLHFHWQTPLKFIKFPWGLTAPIHSPERT